MSLRDWSVLLRGAACVNTESVVRENLSKETSGFWSKGSDRACGRFSWVLEEGSDLQELGLLCLTAICGNC